MGRGGEFSNVSDQRNNRINHPDGSMVLGECQIKGGAVTTTIGFRSSTAGFSRCSDPVLSTFPSSQRRSSIAVAFARASASWCMLIIMLGTALLMPNTASAGRADDEAAGFVSNIQWRWISYQAPHIPPDPHWGYDGGGPFSYSNGYVFRENATQDAHSVFYSSSLDRQRFHYCGEPGPYPPFFFLYGVCGGGNASTTFHSFRSAAQADECF